MILPTMSGNPCTSFPALLESLSFIVDLTNSEYCLERAEVTNKLSEFHLSISSFHKFNHHNDQCTKNKWYFHFSIQSHWHYHIWKNILVKNRVLNIGVIRKSISPSSLPFCEKSMGHILPSEFYYWYGSTLSLRRMVQRCSVSFPAFHLC